MRDEPTNPDPGDMPDTPSEDPAEGAPKMEFPGADTELSGDRNDDLPQRLGERIDPGPDRGIATGEPDLLPDVEPPDNPM
jgi:hypothetical protein